MSDRAAAATAPSPANEAYLARFRRVLAHIDGHLDEDLSLERLADVAAFSKFHFHRQFSWLFGVGAHRYVHLVRLRRASFQLAYRPAMRIIEIALGSGYESHEAFSRAFKKAFGQTPSEFRAAPAWEPWHAIYEPIRQMRSQHMKPDVRSLEVKIAAFPGVRVAALEHRGDPQRIGDTIRRFIEWRREHRLSPRVSATYNVFYESPEDGPPEAFRADICAATDRPVAPNSVGVVTKTIPAGRCAVVRHVGSEDTLGETLRYLYGTWLPGSGEEPGEFPLFFERVSFFPQVPESEAVTDVFLPLEERAAA